MSRFEALLQSVKDSMNGIHDFTDDELRLAAAELGVDLAYLDAPTIWREATAADRTEQMVRDVQRAMLAAVENQLGLNESFVVVRRLYDRRKLARSG